MKARAGEYDSKKKRQKTAKKQNSFSKDPSFKKGTMHRRMKSEERTTSISKEKERENKS